MATQPKAYYGQLNKFGFFSNSHLSLGKFFIIRLSRKAEGYGPLKPWQPTM